MSSHVFGTVRRYNKPGKHFAWARSLGSREMPIHGRSQSTTITTYNRHKNKNPVGTTWTSWRAKTSAAYNARRSYVAVSRDTAAVRGTLCSPANRFPGFRRSSSGRPRGDPWCGFEREVVVAASSFALDEDTLSLQSVRPVFSVHSRYRRSDDAVSRSRSSTSDDTAAAVYDTRYYGNDGNRNYCSASRDNALPARDQREPIRLRWLEWENV